MVALALITLAVAGCGARPDGDGTTRRRTARDRALTPAEQDSVRLLDEERAGARRDAALAAQLRPLLADWEEAWKRVIPGFQLDSLRWQKRDTLVVADQLGGRARAHLVTSLRSNRVRSIRSPLSLIHI